MYTYSELRGSRSHLPSGVSELRAPRLDDGPLLEELFEPGQPLISKLSSANVYLWQATYEPKITKTGEVAGILSC